MVADARCAWGNILLLLLLVPGCIKIGNAVTAAVQGLELLCVHVLCTDVLCYSVKILNAMGRGRRDLIKTDTRKNPPQNPRTTPCHTSADGRDPGQQSGSLGSIRQLHASHDLPSD